MIAVGAETDSENSIFMFCRFLILYAIQYYLYNKEPRWEEPKLSDVQLQTNRRLTTRWVCGVGVVWLYISLNNPFFLFEPIHIPAS